MDELSLLAPAILGIAASLVGWFSAMRIKTNAHRGSKAADERQPGFHFTE